MPNELELIALKTEFELYLGFVKRLVLDLPNADDRSRAALWLMKLKSINHPDQMKLRNEHLKLFLFALHRRSLVGVFEKKPPKDELESFHDGLTLLEMTRELIEITEKQKVAVKKEGEEGFGVCPLPPVQVAFSHDLKEYSACQEIPKFGAHCYYAVCSEPIQLWTKASNNVYPDKAAVPNQLEWELALARVSDHVLEVQAAIDAANDAEKEREQGFVFDDPAEDEDKDKEKKPLQITRCPGERSFRWELNTPLGIYQNYDFSDVGLADDLEGQGKHQLEVDESVLAVLDNSLPGRQRIHIRSPFYEGLPADLAERRYHGVIEEIPEEDDEECEGPPCDEDTACGGAKNTGGQGGSCPCSISQPNTSSFQGNSYRPGGASMPFPQSTSVAQQPGYNMGNNISQSYPQQYQMNNISQSYPQQYQMNNISQSYPQQYQMNNISQSYPQQYQMNNISQSYPQQYQGYNNCPPGQQQGNVSWGGIQYLTPNNSPQGAINQTFMAPNQAQMGQRGFTNNSFGNQNCNTGGYNGMGAGGGGGQNQYYQNNGNGNSQRGPSSQNGAMQQRC